MNTFINYQGSRSINTDRDRSCQYYESKVLHRTEVNRFSTLKRSLLTDYFNDFILNNVVLPFIMLYKMPLRFGAKNGRLFTQKLVFEAP